MISCNASTPVANLLLTDQRKKSLQSVNFLSAKNYGVAKIGGFLQTIRHFFFLWLACLPEEAGTDSFVTWLKLTEG